MSAFVICESSKPQTTFRKTIQEIESSVVASGVAYPYAASLQVISDCLPEQGGCESDFRKTLGHDSKP
jgi:hypothetical protein